MLGNSVLLMRNILNGGGRYSQFSGDARDQRSFTLWASLWLGECLRLAREGAPLLVFSDWRQLPAMTDAVQTAGWHWRGVVCWHKPAARPMRGEFKRDCEFVVYARKGRPVELDEVYLPGMFSMSAPMGPRRVHLTQKPVELIKNMLQVVPKGGVVLDPFLGSGTTAVAAIQTGRSCIGVEITPDNVAIARDRVARRE